MRISDWSSDVCASDLAGQRRLHPPGDRIGAVFLAGALIPALERDEAEPRILAARRAAAPDPRNGEDVRRVRGFVLQQIFFDRLLHLQAARLGGARGQAELHDRAALVLGRQEAGRQAEEHQREQGDDERVDDEEDDLLVDGVADRTLIAIDHPLEAVVEFRSEEHTSELQSLMRISYAVFCLKKKKKTNMSQE